MPKFQHLLVLFAVSITISACTTGTTHNGGGDDQSHSDQIIISQCSKTANSYPYSRDRLLYKQYGDLFTEDATFQLGDNPPVEGREAIVSALKTRGPSMMTRHVSQVVNMQAVANNRAKGISYVLVFRADPEAQSEDTANSTNPWIVAEYHDDFVFNGELCLISNRKIKIIFQRKF